MILWRACLLAPLMHARQCRPRLSIIPPHSHACGRTNGRPILSPTAMRTSSSLRNKPHEDTGIAFSQSPECRAQDPNILSRSMRETPSECSISLTQQTTNRSHARCLWDAGSASGAAELAFDQNSRQSSKAVSRLSAMRGRMRFCRASVLTAEAKKAEDARENAERTPRQATGKQACCHWECEKATFKIETRPSLRIESKRCNNSLSKHLEVLRICISVGTLMQFLTIQRA